MLRIGYLGPKGSFSEEALDSFVKIEPELNKENDLILKPFSSITKLIYECEQNKIDFAFVPLENSIEGQVSVTMDTLGSCEKISIQKEYVHKIEQCLLTHGYMSLKEIRKVYSHEQAFGQCREFLDIHLFGTEQIITASTAEAAQKVSSVKDRSAAIAPKKSALLYNLYCLKEGIQDNQYNSTRFVLVGHGLGNMTGNDKTSLLVVTNNVPGSLYTVLKEFAIRDINLTRIESRPSKQRLGEYVFFIDIDGYVFLDEIQEALWFLREKGVFTKLLGSYPKAIMQF